MANDGIIKDIEFNESTIETVDFALYKYVDETLNLSVMTNEGFKKVQVAWAGTERAFFTKKDRETRDTQGAVQYPLISIKRESFIKDPLFKTATVGNNPTQNDAAGGSVTIARIINPDKTANFVNADSQRRYSQDNFPDKKKKNKKIVYQTITIPMPTFATITYDVGIRTLYQQHMNSIIQPFVNRPGAINCVVIKYENHKYEAFIDPNFSDQGNSSNLNSEERRFETHIKIKVLAHFIGDGENQEKPKIVYRENAVEVKIPRERIVFDDEPDFKNANGYVGAEALFKDFRKI